MSKYDKTYYESHKEQMSLTYKKYYQKHRERELTRQKKLREEHPEYHAEWQRNNKDKLKIIKARYYKKIALHKKRVRQAKLQFRDSKGRFCK